jgi:hypothetical protein
MLVRYDNNGVELVIDNETGEVFASISGYARMSAITQQAISKRVANLTNTEPTTDINPNGTQNHSQYAFETHNQVIKSAIIDTATGAKEVKLIPESVIADWIVKDNPELAKAMLRAGCRVYLYGIAGYEVKAVAPEMPKPAKLPPADIRVVNLANTIAAFDIDIKNPRFKQGLQDVVLNILGVGNSPSGTTEVWLGVAERAEQLGYPIGLVTKHRSQLGKWVAKHEMTCKREKRLCNGTQREINVYLVTDELDDCIKEYLDVKMLSPVD